MRALLLPALLCLLTVAVAAPASADHVEYEVPSNNLYCDGTNGAYGFWGEAYVGSGHDGFGPCRVYLHPSLLAASEAQGTAAPERCYELEWDTGAIQYVCARHGGECGLLEVGEYGPGSPGYRFVCVDDDITVTADDGSAN